MALYVIPVPQPPAGTDWAYTVPGQYIEHITAVSATLTTPCLPGAVMADSSGFANDGTYDPSSTGDVAGCIPGLVAGDFATAITGTGAFLGTAPCGGGVTTRKMFAAGWVQQDIDRFTTKRLVECDSATQICFQLLWVANQMTVFRRWGAGASDFDLVAPPAFPLLGTTPHFLAVSYDPLTDLYSFYVDGVQTGPDIPGTGHPTGVAFTTMFCGQGETGATIVYDEIMWDDNPADPSDIANMFAAAAVSFAAWTAAVLTFNPQAFYHLDETAPGTGRTVDLEITDGTHVVEEVPTGFAAPSAGPPYGYSWQPNLNSSTQTPDGKLTTVAIPPLILPAGYTIGTRTLDLVASDQWSDVFIWWNSDIMDSNPQLNPIDYPPGAYLVIVPTGV